MEEPKYRKLRRKPVFVYDPKRSYIEKISIEINKQGYRITDRSYAPFGNSRAQRKEITRFSNGSRRRLVRLCANNSDIFKYFVTLTYHEIVKDGLLVKKHLNRFLTVLRKSGLKEYIWILEFQERGSIHFHFWFAEHSLESVWREDMPRLREKLVQSLGNDERLKKQAVVVQYLWLKASDQLGDEQAQKAAVDYQVLRSQHAVKTYAMKYGAKLVQKRLPDGVTSVGRWWGASQRVRNEVLFKSVGDERSYRFLTDFCEMFGFPKIGSVVAECEQAEIVWRDFLEAFELGSLD